MGKLEAAIAGWALSLVVPAQETASPTELAGRVLDAAGRPVARALVAFEALPVAPRPPRGLKGRYRLAQAAHRDQARLPRTVTDRDGEWRILLSPQQATLAEGAGAELALRVTAEGHAAWLRAIGTRLVAAAGLEARLEPLAGEDGSLVLQIRAGDAPGRGYVLIERAYRARPDRSVWLRRLVAIDAAGQVRFDEPPRMPGEIEAALPSIRAEGYRVTLFVAGAEGVQRTLGAGRHEIRLETAPDPPRRVLAARAEPARTPIEAVYEVDGEEVVLTLDQPLVPLLGGEAPVRVSSASGPVLVDAWDPDAPLFVEPRPDDRTTEQQPTEAKTAPTQWPRVGLRAVDRRGQRLGSAAAWVEDPGARRLLAAGLAPFAVADGAGEMQLAMPPAGTQRVLIRHPAGGWREILVDPATTGGVLQTELLPPPASAIEPQVAAAGFGTLLVDLGVPADPLELERVVVGVFQTGRPAVQKIFDDHPRLVRVEGLLPGPATVYLRIGDAPARFLGGVLVADRAGSALQPLATAARSFVLDVRDHEGKPVADAYLSLGDGAPRKRRPFTSTLLPLTPEGDRHRLVVHLRGDLFVQVHGPETAQQVLLQGEGGPAILEVALPRPAPPPELDQTVPLPKKDG